MTQQELEPIEAKVEVIFKKLKIHSINQIDPENIAKKYNIEVKSEKMTDEISGLFVIKNEVPHIIYNESHGEKRKRYTISHELGHYFLHNDSNIFIDKTETVMFRNSQSSTGEYKKEIEANAFAAELLMPRKMIVNELAIISDKENAISKLAKKFNVSEQAMGFRLSNLDNIYGIF